MWLLNILVELIIRPDSSLLQANTIQQFKFKLPSDSSVIKTVKIYFFKFNCCNNDIAVYKKTYCLPVLKLILFYYILNNYQMS